MTTTSATPIRRRWVASLATVAIATGAAAQDPATRPAHVTAAELDGLVASLANQRPALREPFADAPAAPFDGPVVECRADAVVVAVPAAWQQERIVRPPKPHGPVYLFRVDAQSRASVSLSIGLRLNDRSQQGDNIGGDLRAIARDDAALADELRALDDLSLMERLVAEAPRLFDRAVPLEVRCKAYVMWSWMASDGVPTRRVRTDALDVYVSVQPPRPAKEEDRLTGETAQVAVLDLYDRASRKCLGFITVGRTAPEARPEELATWAVALASSVRILPATRPATQP